MTGSDRMSVETGQGTRQPEGDGMEPLISSGAVDRRTRAREALSSLNFETGSTAGCC